MEHFSWPLVLQHGDLTLRPLRLRDQRAWQQVRERNAEWLAPWEASNPEGGPRVVNFRGYVANLKADAKADRGLGMAILHRGEFVGQVTLGNVVWGSFRSGYIGYWIDGRVAGRGIMPTAVAMLVDYALLQAGMHRIEINIRPENHASIRVVEKLGFRPEGLRPKYLHIAGGWRDHLSFALTREELPAGGLLAGRPNSH